MSRLTILGLGLALASCRASTEIDVRVSTNVPCASYRGVSITVGRLGGIEANGASTFSDRGCPADGQVGTLVVTPSGGSSDEVAIRVVAGVTKDVSACAAPRYEGCIVARRALKFIPHEPLELPIRLSFDCLDNHCDPNTTCVAGVGCVSARVSDSSKCHGEGCAEGTLGPPVLSPPTGHVVQISAGSEHACAVLDDGTMRCWGNNTGGRVGDGTELDRWTPVKVAGLSKVKSVSTGGTHTCALLADATASCVGANYAGELGVPPGTHKALAPNPIAGLGPVAQITSGDGHVCARLVDGRVSCWGSRKYGALGDGLDEDIVRPPSFVPGLTDVAQLYTGDTVTCARHAKGGFTCWGGYLKSPTTVPDAAVDLACISESRIVVVTAAGDLVVRYVGATGYSEPTTFQKPARPIRAIAGFFETFALLDDGSVVRITDTEVSPVPTLGPGTTAEVSVGHNARYGVSFQCARLFDGSVRCWGGNFQGELADGRPDVLRKAKTIGLTGVATLVRAEFDSEAVTTAITATGSVFAFGRSAPLAIESAAPLAVAFAPAGTAGIALGGRDHGIFLAKTGTATAFVGGKLMTDSKGLESTGFSDFTKVFAAGTFVAGLRSTGALEFVSRNDRSNADGIFGQGNTTAVPAGGVRELLFAGKPLGVVASTNEYQDNNETMCAWFAAGGVQCWGDNQSGLAGRTALSEIVSAPNTIPFADPKTKVIDVSVARLHACAVRDDGAVLCWGSAGDGALGSDRADGPVPSLVPGVTGAKGVACFEHSSCAWLADGRALCWGSNKLGELGDGTLTSRATPAPVLGASGPLADVVRVTQGCALHADTSVSCWGNSFDGETGTGVTGIAATPRLVLGLEP